MATFGSFGVSDDSFGLSAEADDSFVSDFALSAEESFGAFEDCKDTSFEDFMDTDFGIRLFGMPFEEAAFEIVGTEAAFSAFLLDVDRLPTSLSSSL